MICCCYFVVTFLLLLYLCKAYTNNGFKLKSHGSTFPFNFDEANFHLCFGVSFLSFSIWSLNFLFETESDKVFVWSLNFFASKY